MLFSRSILFLLVLLGATLSFPLYDPTLPLELLYTYKPYPVQSYALIITAQSTASGNFFIFNTETPKFSNFISTHELTQTTRTITLTFQNELTNQEAIDLNIDISSCVQEVTYDCYASEFPMPVCSILAPPPAVGNMLRKIEIQDIDCTSGDSNPICGSTLYRDTLTDIDSNDIFISGSTFCPDVSVRLNLQVPVLRAYIPPTFLVGTGDISFHYRSLIPASTSSFTVTGSTKRIDKSSQVSSDINLESFNDNSYTSRSDLKTIIQTQIIKHNYASDIYCQYQIQYTGFVRGVNANDLPGPAHMPRNLDMSTQSTAQSTIRLSLRANELNFINIFGNQLSENTKLIFNYCYPDWRNENELPVVLENYILGNTVAPSEDYTVQPTSYACQNNCLRCTPDYYCIDSTQFLAYGGCQATCSQTFPIPDYKNVCNSVLESATFVTDNPPQITSTDVTMTLYNDLEVSSPFALVLSATNKVYLTTSPYAFPFGAPILPESIPIFRESFTYGEHLITTLLSSTGSSSQIFQANQYFENRITDVSYVLNGLSPILEQVNALYYLLDESSSGFVLTYWNIVPTSLIDKQNPPGMLVCENNKYQHLVGTNYHIAQAFLNCDEECNLQIRSDGRITAYLNEQTLLFDLDFKSIWTYTYPKTFTGFLQLRLIITDASYFQPFVTGTNFNLFIPSNPIAAHPIGPLPVDQHSCNIPNCLNCKDLVCYSCQQNYLLSTDQTACLASCDSDFISPIERVCFTTSCQNNQATVAAEDLCLPSCDQPGHIFMSGEGCQLCVSECQVCSGVNTCAQCKFSDPSNTDTYCARKGGSLYATTPADFNITQTVTVLQNVAKEAALVIADQSSFSNFSFYFANDQRKIPRIIKSLKMDTSDSAISTATIPPLTISQSGNITLHYLDIQEDLDDRFSISGFINKVYRDWPRQDQIALTDTVVGTFTYEQIVNNFQGLSLDNRGYYTVLLSKLYSHDQTAPITCQIQIEFYGEIRGLYVNGELVLSDSTSDYRQTIQSSRFFTLNPNELAFIHIVTCRSQIQSFAFTSCTMNSSPVFPVFRSYVITGSDTTTDTFDVESNIECSQNCFACRDQDRCIICERNYYLDDEGACQPKCSDPSAIQYLSGYCQTTDRSQGYLTYNDYVSATQTKVANFLVYLDLDIELLALMHPYPLSASNHAAFAFVTNNNPSLAQGAYELWDYTRAQAYVNMTMQVQSSVTGKGNLLTVMLLTIRKNYGLLYHYIDLPITLNQWKYADGFEYFPVVSQNTLPLQSKSAYYFYDFFLNCLGTCQVTFQAHGDVEITANERTFVFSSFLEAALGPITLTRTFSGLQHLVFKIWNSNQFEYSISGDYSIFSHGDLIIHQDLNDIPEQLCSQENCLNCYQDKCLSCNPGYFLEPGTNSCVEQCPAGTQANIAERLCGPIICGPGTINSQLVLRDNYCVWSCTDFLGFYYELSQGCTQPCDSSCETCVGPDANQCLSCDTTRALQNDNTCACASGYKLNTITGDCDANPTVQIKVDSFSDLCSNIVFHAKVPSSLDATSINFRWDLVSSTNADTVAQNSIRALLNSQSSNIISFPKVWINNSYSYEISVYFIFDATETISDIITFDNSQSHLSSFSFVNGNSQSIQGYLNNAFQIQLADASCIVPANSLIISWSEIPENYIQLIYNPNSPLTIMLPSCSLMPSSSASLVVRISLTKNPNIYSEQTLTLQTLQEKFEAFIATNNQNHPRNSDLVLQGDIVYYDKCVSRALGQVTYTWLCEDKTNPLNIVPCNDAFGLFGIPRTTNQIIVPSTGLNWGNELLITLLVEKNAVIQSSTLSISIADTNQLIARINCTTLDCLRYAPNQEFLFSATLSTVSGSNTMPRELTWAERSKLAFTWNVYPSVPFVYFEETLKLFSSTLQLPENIDFITIELVVRNSTKIGTARLILPINRPPALGTFTAIPLSGTSLSTLFTLQANGWQDDDLTLTYQFSYLFSSDLNPTPLLHDYNPENQVISILPGQRPTGLVTLQARIRDYFGAESIATTQVQVSPPDQTLQEALDSYNQILQTPSGTFTVIQTISMITKELSDWEGLLTRNAPDPVCPSCSGRGYCSSNLARCVCQSGWAFYDCSLPQSNVSAVVDFKQILLEKITQTMALQTLDTTPITLLNDLIYGILKGSCHSQHFNSNATLTLLQNIIENALNSDIILTPRQAEDLAQILSDLMSFSAIYDCSKSTQFTKNLEAKTQFYLEKIAQSSLNGKITNENATIIGTENIDMYFRKLSICSVSNLIVSPGIFSPQVTININVGLTANCSSGVNLELYAFNDDLLNCSKEVSTENNKTIIGINLTDPETGKTPSNVSVIIDYGGDKTKCPSKCKTLVDNLCYCPDLSPFDVKNQIKKVFGDSNLDYLEHIESLVHFKFWNSAIFWLLFAFTLWFIITLYVVIKKIPTYDRISNFKKLHHKAKFMVIRTAIMVTHPLTSIYCVRKREELSKMNRALLYYSGTLLTLVFASIFSGPGRDDTSETYQILTISLDFNIYEFLLPYFSIIPLSMLIEWLLKTEIKREEIDLLQDKKKKNVKYFFTAFKLNFGYVVTIASVLASLLAILIIAANMTSFQKLAWIINFVQLLLQDNLMNFIVFFALQCLFLRLYYRYPNDPTIQKKLRSWLDDDFFQIMATITERPPINAKSIHPEQKLDKTSPTVLLLHSSTLTREEFADKSPLNFKANTLPQLQDSTPSIQIVSPADSDVLLSKTHQTFALNFKDMIQKQRDVEEATPTTKIFSKTPLSFDTTFYDQNSKRLSVNSKKKISIDTHETSQISIDASASPSPYQSSKRMSFLSLLNNKGLNSPTSPNTGGSSQGFESSDGRFSLDYQAALRVRDLRKARQRSAILNRKNSLFKNLPEHGVAEENNTVQSFAEIELKSDENELFKPEVKKAASDELISNNDRFLLQKEQREAILNSIKRTKIELDLQKERGGGDKVFS